MKVSFGMGMAARVPWISFTAPGMSPPPTRMSAAPAPALAVSYPADEPSIFCKPLPSSPSPEIPLLSKKSVPKKNVTVPLEE